MNLWIIFLFATKISIFPNPITDKLHIQIAEDVEGWLLLSDYMERLILEEEISSNMEINFGLQNSGVYFITVRTEDGILTEKVLKF